MLNILPRKPDPAVAVAPDVTDEDVARLKARRRELSDRLEAMRTALKLIAPDGLGRLAVDRLSDEMRLAAEPYTRWSRRKIDREMERAHGDLAAAIDDHNDAVAERDRLAIRDMRSKAKALQPEHRAVVNRAADALELLNAALIEERRIRESCHRNAVTYLPDLSLPALGFAGDHNSAISRWANAARRAGYLE